MKPSNQLALGTAMIGFAISMPALAVPFHLELLSLLLFVMIPSWILSWFGGVHFAKGYAAVRYEAQTQELERLEKHIADIRLQAMTMHADQDIQQPIVH